VKKKKKRPKQSFLCSQKVNLTDILRSKFETTKSIKIKQIIGLEGEVLWRKNEPSTVHATHGDSSRASLPGFCSFYVVVLSPKINYFWPNQCPMYYVLCIMYYVCVQFWANKAHPKIILMFRPKFYGIDVHWI
jgi:hypothetical protein